MCRVHAEVNTVIQDSEVITAMQCMHVVQCSESATHASHSLKVTALGRKGYKTKSEGGRGERVVRGGREEKEGGGKGGEKGGRVIRGGREDRS